MNRKATQTLRNLGQSIWLDKITRNLLESGTLAREINEFSVTGVTSATAKKCWRRSPGPASILTPWRLGFKRKGRSHFVTSWNDLMNVIATKSAALQTAAGR
jgi:hypothetical protein